MGSLQVERLLSTCMPSDRFVLSLSSHSKLQITQHYFIDTILLPSSSPFLFSLFPLQLLVAMAGCNAKHDNLQDNPLRLSLVFISFYLFDLMIC